MDYYLPPEIQYHINGYAKPATRPDWRKGSYFLRNICKLQLLYISNMYLMYKLDIMSSYHNVIPHGRAQWDRHITDIIPVL
jgi:hypothetical protein